MRFRFRCLHSWNPEKNSCVSRFLHLGERFYFVPFRACVSFVFVYCRVNGRPKRKNILAFSLAALSCKRTQDRIILDSRTRTAVAGELPVWSLTASKYLGSIVPP